MEAILFLCQALGTKNLISKPFQSADGQGFSFLYYLHRDSGIILCMRPANGRPLYNVMSSLIGWAHTQNDPWGLGTDPGKIGRSQYTQRWPIWNHRRFPTDNIGHPVPRKGKFFKCKALLGEITGLLIQPIYCYCYWDATAIATLHGNTVNPLTTGYFFFQNMFLFSYIVSCN